MDTSIFSCTCSERILITEPTMFFSLRNGLKYHIVTEIIEKVREAPGTMGPFRPEVSQIECTAELRALLQHCWSETPDERPNLAEVFYSLKKMNVLVL